jgi:syntaxin 1B/2/3
MNGNDPNRLLNKTRTIDREIDELQGDLDRLKMMQDRAFHDTQMSREQDERSVHKEVERLAERVIARYRDLTAQIQRLKSDPESGNPRNAPQVGKVDRRLKKMINAAQQQDVDYRKKLQERSAREYRIVRPDASDAEVREATQDPGNTQIFSQAVCVVTHHSKTC